MESNADESDHKTAEEGKESRRMRTVDLKKEKKGVRLNTFRTVRDGLLGR